MLATVTTSRTPIFCPECRWRGSGRWLWMVYPQFGTAGKRGNPSHKCRQSLFWAKIDGLWQRTSRAVSAGISAVWSSRARLAVWGVTAGGALSRGGESSGGRAAGGEISRGREGNGWEAAGRAAGGVAFGGDIFFRCCCAAFKWIVWGSGWAGVAVPLVTSIRTCSGRMMSIPIKQGGDSSPTITIKQDPQRASPHCKCKCCVLLAICRGFP